MSPRAASLYPIFRRFPRVSGDEPGESAQLAIDTTFSPRERG